MMEATGVYWEVVFDALDSAGITPILVHAQHVKQIKGRKTDIADSVWLARICQFGLCTPSFVPPAAFRDLRKVSRQRRKVVGLRATPAHPHPPHPRQCRPAGSAACSQTCSAPMGGAFLTGLPPAARARTSWPPSHVMSGPGWPNCAMRSAPNSPRTPASSCRTSWRPSSRPARASAPTTPSSRDRLAPYRNQVDLLTTLPGIDQDSACAILIELGPDIQVFPSHRHCAAWAGLCPGNNESAGKKRHGTTRKGNTVLRSILIECAHGAARTNQCQFQGYHKALTVRRGYKRATVATAHKLLRIIYRMLATGQVYRDPDTDYEALMVKRNAPRWIAMLKKHGMDPATRSTTTQAAA